MRAKCLRVAIALEKHLGVPQPPALLPDPLDLLIATILSQNTNDKNSYRAYTQLRRKYRTWERVAMAPVRSIASVIRIGGMAKQKSRRIKETLAEIHTQHGEYSLKGIREESNDQIIESLTRIKGVGTKTASCVLLFSLGRDVFPVDTHVHRICNRLGLVPRTNYPEKTFAAMSTIFPRGRGYTLHTNLIRFGRMICRSQQPLCHLCPLFGECTYGDKVRVPVARNKSSQTDYDFMLLDNIPAKK